MAPSLGQNWNVSGPMHHFLLDRQILVSGVWGIAGDSLTNKWATPCSSWGKCGVIFWLGGSRPSLADSTKKCLHARQKSAGSSTNEESLKRGCKHKCTRGESRRKRRGRREGKAGRTPSEEDRRVRAMEIDGKQTGTEGEGGRGTRCNKMFGWGVACKHKDGRGGVRKRGAGEMEQNNNKKEVRRRDYCCIYCRKFGAEGRRSLKK